MPIPGVIETRHGLNQPRRVAQVQGSELFLVRLQQFGRRRSHQAMVQGSGPASELRFLIRGKKERSISQFTHQHEQNSLHRRMDISRDGMHEPERQFAGTVE